MTETEIIQLFHGPGAATLADTARLPPGPSGDHTLVTTDALVEGTHFRLDWSSPEDLAIKLFQSNVSDLCVSGARPAWGLLNLGLPRVHDESFFRRFAAALLAEFKESGCDLIGGDTFRAPALFLSLTLGGPATRVLRRDGGRAGDVLYLSGTIGLALAGFRLLSGDFEASENPSLAARARERHLRPRARATWAREIAAQPGVRAAMDLSDGLFRDAPRLARASGLRLAIELYSLPVEAGILAQKWLSLAECLLSGEEFELLFLGEPGLQFTFPCRPIGIATATGSEPVRYMRDGMPVDLTAELTAASFDHFSG